MQVCNVVVGKGAMYPYFAHSREVDWYNDTYVNPCGCNTKESGRPDDCSKFDFQVKWSHSPISDRHHKIPDALTVILNTWQLLFFYLSAGCFINFPITSAFYNTSIAHSLNTVVNNFYYEITWANCPKFPSTLNPLRNANPVDLKLKVNYLPKLKQNYAQEPPTDLIQDYYRCK
jgi:hypothetical protein